MEYELSRPAMYIKVTAFTAILLMLPMLVVYAQRAYKEADERLAGHLEQQVAINTMRLSQLEDANDTVSKRLERILERLTIIEQQHMHLAEKLSTLINVTIGIITAAGSLLIERLVSLALSIKRKPTLHRG